MSFAGVKFKLRSIVKVNDKKDFLFSRKKAKEIIQKFGFDLVDQTRILISVSELTRNVCKYAGKGEVIFQAVFQDERKGLKIIFQDKGPGIPDIERAMREGYSTSGGLGEGLPIAKKTMDEFKIKSEIGKGTKVTVIKWL